jgi:hypothetical protein
MVQHVQATVRHNSYGKETTTTAEPTAMPRVDTSQSTETTRRFSKLKLVCVHDFSQYNYIIRGGKLHFCIANIWLHAEGDGG